MKTLDDVIKANECCNHGEPDSRCEECPYNGIGACCLERESDALHYLKEYKRVQNKIEKIALGNIEDTLDKLDNKPLTWEELIQMDGKPVWIEAESLSVGVSPYWKDWYIIKSFSNDEFMYCNDSFEWAKEMQGRLWQAYRKEQE